MGSPIIKPTTLAYCAISDNQWRFIPFPSPTQRLTAWRQRLRGCGPRTAASTGYWLLAIGNWLPAIAQPIRFGGPADLERSGDAPCLFRGAEPGERTQSQIGSRRVQAIAGLAFGGPAGSRPYPSESPQFLPSCRARYRLRTDHHSVNSFAFSTYQKSLRPPPQNRHRFCR